MNKALLRVFAIILLITGWILAEPCAADEKVTVKDMVGREVTLPKDPERVICLSPGTLRLILYVVFKHGWTDTVSCRWTMQLQKETSS